MFNRVVREVLCEKVTNEQRLDKVREGTMWIGESAIPVAKTAGAKQVSETAS